MYNRSLRDIDNEHMGLYKFDGYQDIITASQNNSQLLLK